MALQGTIDAFPVADVLQLLAGSHKSGRLIVDGDRSTAQLFVADGAVTGGSIRDVDSADVADVVVELLRYRAGSFLFEPGASAPVSEGSEDLGAVVAVALDRLAAWTEIEAVVPSTLHRLVLAERIGEEGVHLDAADWSVIVAAGRNDRVADLVTLLGRPEIETCARVAALVGRELVTVEGPAADLVPVSVAAQRPVADGPGTDPGHVEAGVPDVSVVDAVDPDDRSTGADPAYEVVLLDDDGGDSFPDRFPIDDLIGADEEVDPWVNLEAVGREERLAAAQSFDAQDLDVSAFGPAGGSGDVVAPLPADGVGAFHDQRSATSTPTAFDAPSPTAADHGSTAFGGADPHPAGPLGAHGDTTVLTTAFDGTGAFTDAPVGPPDTGADTAADEVLRQMSKLSPKAAEAIAAALGSAGDQPSTASGSVFGTDAVRD